MAAYNKNVGPYQSSEYSVCVGQRVSVTFDDCQYLWQQTKTEGDIVSYRIPLDKCVTCKQTTQEGHLALESVLLLNRQRRYQPRVACYKCAADYAQRYGQKGNEPVQEIRPIICAWYELQNTKNPPLGSGQESPKDEILISGRRGGLPLAKADMVPPLLPVGLATNTGKTGLTFSNDDYSSVELGPIYFSTLGEREKDPRIDKNVPRKIRDPIGPPKKAKTNWIPKRQGVPEQNKGHSVKPAANTRIRFQRSKGMQPTSTKNLTQPPPTKKLTPSTSADETVAKPALTKMAKSRSPPEKGFLVVTQLVKTGAADEAGLHVGDVFTKFGDLTPNVFSGLKQVADLVHKSAKQTLPVTVIRRLQNIDENGLPLVASNTVMKQIQLSLCPFESQHDGGGVLGAVINIWPLPENVV